MNIELMTALGQLEREKGISKEIILDALEAALIKAYNRHFDAADNVRVHVDRRTGQVQVYASKTVVENVTEPHYEISLEEATQRNPDYELDDVVEEEVTPKDFGRIAAQTAKQVVMQRLREAQRGMIFEEYASREGEIINGIVQRFESRSVVVDLGKTEALLLPNEQMPTENYRFGDRIKTYIVEVKRTSKGPQIMLSRTHPGLVKRMFELEVPEIGDGTVEIKAVAREAGSRSKVAVFSRDPNVDAVGSCVGPKGMRVQTVVSELKGEKIDIVEWSLDPEQLVANALSPSRVVLVTCDQTEKVARVIVPDHQLSLAIGKEGQNVRLAARLTGWKIDIKSESQARSGQTAGVFVGQEEEEEDDVNEE